MSENTNKSFPTAFKVFTSAHTLTEKRFMRQVCEVVEASTGMKARSKWNTVAGTRLEGGNNVTAVPGFNVLVECEKKTDRAGVRKLFWTPEAQLQDGDFDVITVPAHSKSVRVDDVSSESAVDVVARLLGIENVTIPSSWSEKAVKLTTTDVEKAEKKAARELKKAANAQKRADYAAGVLARKTERAAKKAAKLTPVAPATEPLVPEASADAETTPEVAAS